MLRDDDLPEERTPMFISMKGKWRAMPPGAIFC